MTASCAAHFRHVEHPPVLLPFQRIQLTAQGDIYISRGESKRSWHDAIGVLRPFRIHIDLRNI
jgi:hypothetical protein